MSFHVDRVPVIQNTWAKQVKHIRYYSDSYGKLLAQTHTLFEIVINIVNVNVLRSHYTDDQYWCA